ncbi:unnamed protein product [Cyprideis torosa]|uniref:Uncharacterized protein n=1 Tax=Cyprideis torosa TaxID=163714 RepID=A0A7R8ZKY0_9CRUS|nr:unnamed protein product [Cyprideis torosa]CAG0885377.1 unnamed protein product [Cyprideis torosa]
MSFLQTTNKPLQKQDLGRASFSLSPFFFPHPTPPHPNPPHQHQARLALFVLTPIEGLKIRRSDSIVSDPASVAIPGAMEEIRALLLGDAHLSKVIQEMEKGENIMKLVTKPGYEQHVVFSGPQRIGPPHVVVPSAPTPPMSPEHEGAEVPGQASPPPVCLEDLLKLSKEFECRTKELSTSKDEYEDLWRFARFDFGDDQKGSYTVNPPSPPSSNTSCASPASTSSPDSSSSSPPPSGVLSPALINANLFDGIDDLLEDICRNDASTPGDSLLSDLVGNAPPPSSSNNPTSVNQTNESHSEPLNLWDATLEDDDLEGLELRHDCMWSGKCPSQEHHAKDALPVSSCSAVAPFSAPTPCTTTFTAISSKTSPPSAVHGSSQSSSTSSAIAAKQCECNHTSCWSCTERNINLITCDVSQMVGTAGTTSTSRRLLQPIREMMSARENVEDYHSDQCSSSGLEDSSEDENDSADDEESDAEEEGEEGSSSHMTDDGVSSHMTDDGVVSTFPNLDHCYPSRPIPQSEDISSTASTSSSTSASRNTYSRIPPFHRPPSFEEENWKNLLTPSESDDDELVQQGQEEASASGTESLNRRGGASSTCPLPTSTSTVSQLRSYRPRGRIPRDLIRSSSLSASLPKRRSRASSPSNSTSANTAATPSAPRRFNVQLVQNPLELNKMEEVGIEETAIRKQLEVAIRMLTEQKAKSGVHLVKVPNGETLKISLTVTDTPAATSSPATNKASVEKRSGTSKGKQGQLESTSGWTSRNGTRKRKRSSDANTRNVRMPKLPKLKYEFFDCDEDGSHNSSRKKKKLKLNKVKHNPNIRNENEKQRRVCLKRAYETLKAVLPDAESKKMPKLVILKEGQELCQKLQSQEFELEQQMQRELNKQRLLQEKLVRLKREMGLN